MRERITIVGPDDPLPEWIAELVAESDQAGFHFLRRLVEEWASGANRFSQPGETLLVAEVDSRVVGVCGLNVDPYLSDGRVGRVRHLYVAAAYRRRGIGGRLVDAVVAAASGAFDRLRLRTNSDSAAQFYEARGFRRQTGEPHCTHVLAGLTRKI